MRVISRNENGSLFTKKLALCLIGNGILSNKMMAGFEFV